MFKCRARSAPHSALCIDRVEMRDAGFEPCLEYSNKYICLMFELRDKIEEANNPANNIATS